MRSARPPPLRLASSSSSYTLPTLSPSPSDSSFSGLMSPSSSKSPTSSRPMSRHRLSRSPPSSLSTVKELDENSTEQPDHELMYFIPEQNLATPSFGDALFDILIEEVKGGWDDDDDEQVVPMYLDESPRTSDECVPSSPFSPFHYSRFESCLDEDNTSETSSLCSLSARSISNFIAAFPAPPASYPLSPLSPAQLTTFDALFTSPRPAPPPPVAPQRATPPAESTAEVLTPPPSSRRSRHPRSKRCGIQVPPEEIAALFALQQEQHRLLSSGEMSDVPCISSSELSSSDEEDTSLPHTPPPPPSPMRANSVKVSEPLAQGHWRDSVNTMYTKPPVPPRSSYPITPCTPSSARFSSAPYSPSVSGTPRSILKKRNVEFALSPASSTCESNRSLPLSPLSPTFTTSGSYPHLPASNVTVASLTRPQRIRPPTVRKPPTPPKGQSRTTPVTPRALSTISVSNCSLKSSPSTSSRRSHSSTSSISSGSSRYSKSSSGSTSGRMPSRPGIPLELLIRS